MWLVKWVEMDNTFTYSSEIKFADTYDEAREIMIAVEERFRSQGNEPKDADSMQIVSEPIIVDVDIESDSNLRNFHPDEMLYCKKCPGFSDRIIAHTAISVEMVWNDKESEYQTCEEEFSLEQSTSVYCAKCLTDLLK